MKSRMVTYMVFCGVLLLGAGTALAEEVKTPVHRISETGVGEEIGFITFTDSPQGVLINVDIAGLTPGIHGMHIHEVGDCGPGMVDGKPVAGLAAKGHFDPDKTGAHHGPQGAGHKGDLPALSVAENGVSKGTMAAPNLKVSDIRGRSVMIHAGGDNYADTPAPLGGGGARVACGVIR